MVMPAAPSGDAGIQWQAYFTEYAQSFPVVFVFIRWGRTLAALPRLPPSIAATLDLGAGHFAHQVLLLVALLWVCTVPAAPSGDAVPVAAPIEAPPFALGVGGWARPQTRPSSDSDRSVSLVRPQPAARTPHRMPCAPWGYRCVTVAGLRHPAVRSLRPPPHWQLRAPWWCHCALLLPGTLPGTGCARARDVHNLRWLPSASPATPDLGAAHRVRQVAPCCVVLDRPGEALAPMILWVGGTRTREARLAAVGAHARDGVELGLPTAWPSAPSPFWPACRSACSPPPRCRRRRRRAPERSRCVVGPCRGPSRAWLRCPAGLSAAARAHHRRAAVGASVRLFAFLAKARLAFGAFMASRRSCLCLSFASSAPFELPVRSCCRSSPFDLASAAPFGRPFRGLGLLAPREPFSCMSCMFLGFGCLLLFVGWADAHRFVCARPFSPFCAASLCCALASVAADHTDHANGPSLVAADHTRSCEPDLFLC